MKLHIKIPPPDLHQGQQMILESPARFKVVSAGRRFGKTLLAIEWLAFAEGGALDGASVGFFAPTYKLLMEAWNDFEYTLTPIMKRSNKTEMRMELITVGKIDFWTLEDNSAGRGRKYHRIVIDEAAHARNLKNIWEQSISPTLTDYRGEAWFISTPSGVNFFYELYQRGLDPAYPDWASFQMPTSANPYIPAAEIEQMRQQLPELVFRQEYLAEFVTMGAGLIKPEYIISAPAPTNARVVLGVDLAISQRTGADYTAICAMSRDEQSGIIYIHEVERFRGQFAEVLERIKAAAARHNPALIAIEETQYQAAVVQELARTTTLPVRGVRPDRDKITRFAPLLTRYERHMVRHDESRIPAVFRDELLSFPQGEHDDMVDAASHAYYGLELLNASQANPTHVLHTLRAVRRQQ
jgi:predicted phage terminase large subunit-like protein